MEECLDCGSDKIEFDGRCASCNHARRKEARQARQPKKKQKPLRQVAPERSEELKIYYAEKAVWIKNLMCAVFPTLKAQDVHHKKGRDGYADDWARDNDVSLLLDKRFWLPVSRKGHILIDAKPEWAKKNGYTISRLI
jgi:hypothetical protein